MFSCEFCEISKNTFFTEHLRTTPSAAFSHYKSKEIYILINPLSTNPTKWSDTLKQFVGCCRRIVCVCLTILWGWCLKDYYIFKLSKYFKMFKRCMFHQTSVFTVRNILKNRCGFKKKTAGWRSEKVMGSSCSVLEQRFYLQQITMRMDLA